MSVCTMFCSIVGSSMTAYDRMKCAAAAVATRMSVNRGLTVQRLTNAATSVKCSATSVAKHAPRNSQVVGSARLRSREMSDH